MQIIIYCDQYFSTSLVAVDGSLVLTDAIYSLRVKLMWSLWHVMSQEIRKFDNFLMKDGQRTLMFFYQEGDPPNMDGTIPDIECCFVIFHYFIIIYHKMSFIDRLMQCLADGNRVIMRRCHMPFQTLIVSVCRSQTRTPGG